MQRTCLICGTVISGRDDKKYCSTHCQRRAYRMRKGAKICKYCKSIFDPGDNPNREYCSMNHYRLDNGLGYDDYQMFRTETCITERGTYEAV